MKLLAHGNDGWWDRAPVESIRRELPDPERINPDDIARIIRADGAIPSGTYLAVIEQRADQTPAELEPYGPYATEVRVTRGEAHVEVSGR